MGLRQVLLFTVGLVAIVSQFARIFTMDPNIRAQDVLLVTAHPDDESMFFGPTIRHVINTGNRLHYLVLSNGNGDGLGKIREQEMLAVAPMLGSPQESVTVLDDPKLQDGNQWDPQDVAAHVRSAIERTKATTIITFDEYGVSGHFNHHAVHDGVILAATEQEDNEELVVLTLFSVPLWRKYLFSMDSIISRVARLNRTQYTIISGSMDYSRVRRALTTAHKSQMVWFRWLWAFFSRYMVVNDLVEIDIGHGLASSREKFMGPRASNIQTSVQMPARTNKAISSIVSTATSAISKPITRQRPQHTEL